MKKVLKLTESNLIKLIKNIIKEQGEEEVVISPEEYYTLLKNVYYQAHAIPRLRPFRGKKLVIDGSLNFTPFQNEIHLTDLGNIKVNGSIDISYTKIKSLDDVEVSGSKRYWNTPYESVIKARIQKEKQNKQEERRENNEWDLNDTDEEGEKANAAFEYAVNEGELKTLDEEQKEELENLKTRLSELELQMKAEEDEERYDELSNEFDEVQEEIDGFEDYVDVYDLYPNGSHYSMDSFESLSTGTVFAVGTMYEADTSMESYYEEMLDNVKSYFSKEHLSNYIDAEKVKDYFSDLVEEWVRESPESYDVDKELSDDQEEEIWLLQMEKWVYENEGVRAPISEPTREDGDVFDFEDVGGNRFQYRNTSADPSLYKSESHWVLYKDGAVVSPHQIYDDEDIQDYKDERESRISDIEYEIQEIKDNPDGDLDESSVESAVEDYLDNIERDPFGFLEDMGYTDFEEFINLDELKDDLISQADYGETLNSYNGTYEEITINGTDYIVMRTD
jgi:predicted  nucleic acid-binding Zn-ribbon protein